VKAFSRSLLAEISKSRNSLAEWLALLGTSGIIVAFLVVLLFGTEHFLPGPDEHPWHHFFLLYYEATASMLLPLYAIIMAALVCFIENRNTTWKLIMTLGISRTHLYLSKLLFTYLLIAVSHFYFVALVLISGAVLGVFRAELRLLEIPPDFMLLLKLAVKTLLSVGGMLALQFWASIRFRSFIVSLGVGVIGFVVTSLLIEWTYIRWIPYAYPLLYLQDVNTTGILTSIEVYSIMYFLLFATLGCLDFRRAALPV